MSRKKHNPMNEDIKKYPIYILSPVSRKLKRVYCIHSTDDYNHDRMHLHHYIQKSDYVVNEQWYKERGINQFLILLPIPIHEQIHGIGIKTLTDEQFKDRFGISKWSLIFNKKYSKY